MLDPVQFASFIQAAQSESAALGSILKPDAIRLADHLHTEGGTLFDAAVHVAGNRPEPEAEFDWISEYIGPDLYVYLGNAEGVGATPSQVAQILVSVAVDTRPE